MVDDGRRALRAEVATATAGHEPRSVAAALIQAGGAAGGWTPPEHLSLASQGIPAGSVLVEPTGADTQIYAKSAAGALNAIFRERHTFKPGDHIVLAPESGSIHVFDAADGKRIGGA